MGKYGATGLFMMVLALGACGQQDVQPESGRELGIPTTGQESPTDGPESEESTGQSLEESTPASTPGVGDEGQDGSLSQPTYIGSWRVTDYCYPSTPCGLSQLEVDVLLGSELTYAPESFTCNQRVVESEGFGYEFSFYDSLAEYEQDYNVSVSGWFAGGDMGMVKSGYPTIEEGIFGNHFSYMEEQPDKILINYYGVVFLAAREQASDGSAAVSPRDRAYGEALSNLLLYNQLPLGQDSGDMPEAVYFAIQDIDGDGREELLINYGGSMMATIQEMVYDYDGGKGELYREIWDFPDIKFYVSGYARSDMSHNHTRSDFWPYHLYRYDSGTDQYELAFTVTAWDKELSETDSDGNSFPDEKDVSGTGRVYLTTDCGTEETWEPMDVTEYDQWYAGLIGEDGAAELVIEWQLLDEVNLKSLLVRLNGGTY